MIDNKKLPESLQWPLKGLDNKELFLTEELQNELKMAWSQRLVKKSSNKLVGSIIDIYEFFYERLKDEAREIKSSENKILEEGKSSIDTVTDPEEKMANENQLTTAVNTVKSEKRLIEIDNAIKRLQDGSYGFCQEELMPIPLQRLNTVPETKYLASVQEDKEKANKSPNRKKFLFSTRIEKNLENSVSLKGR